MVYYLVVIQLNKLILYIDYVSIDHSIYHNSQIGKLVCLVVTTCSPFDNNWSKGRGSKRIKRNTYKPVCRVDGNYNYPRISEHCPRL